MGESKLRKQTGTYAMNKAKAKPNSKMFGIFVAIIVVVLIGALVVLNELQPSKSGTAPTTGTTYDVSTAGQPVLGNANAKVEIVEFGDFKCPTCRAFETDTFPQLKAQYIDTDKVKFSFINFSFMSQNMGLKDNDSRRAALFGEAIYKQSPEAFWTYYQELYNNQGDEREAWATEDFLKQLAGQIPGIDVDKVVQDVRDEADAEALAADQTMVNQLGISSTPTLFVNGQLVPGYTMDAITPMVEAELAK